MPPLQLTPDGSLRHLITLAGLPQSLLHDIFSDADFFAKGDAPRLLAGKLLVNIFFESSTRTRAAFEASAKQLGADVINLDQITMAGDTKRESLSDTVRTVAAMGAAGIALRHSEHGAAAEAAAAATDGVAVINGGNNCEAHPTQGLTDAYTLRERFGEDFSGLAVAIVGNVLHSRVARSDLHVLRIMGASDIRLIGPKNLCPPFLAEELGAPVFDDMEEGLSGADVIILLRVQRERLQTALPVADYFAQYGMTEQRLSRIKKDAMILHPGPINRGIEISDAAADSAQSFILRQVTNGMAIRKAVLSRLCGR